MQTITVFKITDFRKWLKKNHKKESKVAVIIHKKHTGKSSPSHREMLEEAICFGWVDTTVKRIDDDTFVRHFSKRNKNSKWSNNTLKYAKDLIKQGRMTEQGMKFYKLGAAKPVHDDGIPENPDMPPEIKKALLKDKKAQEGFEKITPSTRKMYFRWFLSAKLPETKKKRIKEIIKVAREKY